MSNYSISIIIPIYNGEKYIKKGLDSIINQTLPFEKLEVIVLNDNSTDSSLSILTEYKNKYNNIVLINLEENFKNPSYPRNIGIDHSSADYIMFMDIDDFYETDSCEILYNNALKHDSDIVSGRYYKLYDNVKVKGHEIEKEVFIKTIDEYPELLEQNAFLWNKIFKKSFINKFNIRFTTLGVGDIVFTSQCLLKAKNILFLKDEYIYTKFINSKSISTDKSGKYFDYYLEGCYNLYDIFKENNSLKYFKYFIKMRINHLFKVIVDSEIEDEKKIEFLKKLRKLIDLASKEGTDFDERISFLVTLIDSEQFDNIFYFMRYTKISIKRQTDKKILKEKNKILKEKNKILKEKNKILKKRIKYVKEKNKNLIAKINEISNVKGYIKYKFNNLKKKIRN